MQIHRLRLTNFRQHADTTLSFGEGLTGIIGPNGAGKTTLLEAIAWAMYGTQAARGTRDSIRRRNAPPRSRVEVELDFVLGAQRYRVVRSLQQAALYQDGELAPIANSNGAVTDKVTRLLGMTRGEFFNTYFTGQKELAIMASMTAPDRARFLSRVLGYERLAIVQIRLREDRSALKASLATAETGLIDLETLKEEERGASGRIAVAEQAMKTAKVAAARADLAAAERRPVWQQWESRREEVQSVETDLNIAVHQAVEARRAFEELDRDLAEAVTAATKRDELLPQLAQWDGLVETRDRLDREAQAYAGRRAVEAQLTEVRASLGELEKRLGQLPTEPLLQAARDKAAGSVSLAEKSQMDLDEEQKRWHLDQQDAATKRTSLLKQFEDYQKQVARLKEAGPVSICPTCGKPLGKEYEKVLDDLETSLAEVVQEGNFYKRRIAQLAAEPAELAKAKAAAEVADRIQKADHVAVVRAEAGVAERERLRLRALQDEERATALAAELAATPTSYDELEHRRIRDRLAALEPARTQLARLSAVADRAPTLVPKAAAAELAHSRFETIIAERRARLVTLGWSAELHEQAKQAFQEAEQAIQAAQIGTVRSELERKAAEEHRAAVARRREERDARAVEIDRLRGEVIFHQELDRAFTDLRDELNAALRPDLSDAASSLLHDLTNGRYADLEITEDYIPAIVDDGEPKTVVSGGEEDIANLALRLAISQMIADRAGQPFSLLILDEVFGSLDEERRTAVMDLLRTLADRFPQVILITHIESVRDGFDRVIRIDYDVERGIASAREERPTTDEAPHVAA